MGKESKKQDFCLITGQERKHKMSLGGTKYSEKRKKKKRKLGRKKKS